MRTITLSIGCDTQDAAGAQGTHIAMTVHMPDGAPSGRVIFASPGGGYGRGYYDMSFPGRTGYSQAEHHCARGHIVVAYDHLGVGDSSRDSLAAITIEEIADTNHQAITTVMERLRDGTLCPNLEPLAEARFIGIGQSMGGGVSIIMQARHQCFDAVAVLGYSAIHTQLPQRTAAQAEAALANYMNDRQTPGHAMSVAESAQGVADFVYPFHWEDVPADILAIDMDGGYPVRQSAPPFGSLTIPNCVVGMMSPGYVRDEAASIDVPLFLGFGERDVSADFRAEPGAYPCAHDISLVIVPRMAHMHNFASSREQLWDRLDSWYGSI